MTGGAVSNACLVQDSDAPARAVTESPVCVECGRSVELLLRQYTRGIRLGRCGYCCSVADKYIECEFVLIAIDLALHRIQAYRHLLFNRKPFSTHTFLLLLLSGVREFCVVFGGAVCDCDCLFHVCGLPVAAVFRIRLGRLWQLGVAMAALDAHLRHTALSSEPWPPGVDPSHQRSGVGGVSDGEVLSAGDPGGDPFWETGALLLAAVLEHMCFAVGAVMCARQMTSSPARKQRNGGSAESRSSSSSGSSRGTKIDVSPRGAGASEKGTARGDANLLSSPRVGVGQGYSGAATAGWRPTGGDTREAPGCEVSAPPRALTTKMYMAVVYPLFFRLLAAFVMIWDRQVAILNTIELLVATMQFVALSAVIGGPATKATGFSGMGSGKFAAATSVVAGLATKMVGRGLMCRYLGTDTRTLTML